MARTGMIISLKRFIHVLLPVALAIAWFLPVSAAASGAISQGFTTSDTAIPGTLMSLKSGSQNVAELAGTGNVTQLLGVTGDKPLIELGSGAQQVQVVVSGVTGAFVSDINGGVKTGDKITASPIAGIGMKAKTSTQIVGTAQSNLGDSQATERTVKDSTGKSQKVKIALIALQVNVTYYAVPQDKLGSVVPGFLLNFGSAIAGKDVSALRVLIGFFALLIGFAIVAIMLQSAIRSGIISIGRNPLAQTALRRSCLTFR